MDEKVIEPMNLSLSFVESKTAYISVGSNLGDKSGFCLTALDLLEDVEGIHVQQRSSLYRSAPLGPEDQEWYVNIVVKITTSLSPQELLAALHLIEMQLHRKREVHWGPRTIDLDILFFDDLVLDTPHLHIPHPQAHRRHFVLLPLAEIAPRLIHPILKKPVKTLLRNLKGKSECHPLTSEGRI